MTTSALDITADTTAIVEIYEFTSGNSSVPIPLSAVEHLGTLVQVDDTTFTITDGDVQIARIEGCYHADELMDGRRYIDGWDVTSGARVWARWAITY